MPRRLLVALAAIALAVPRATYAQQVLLTADQAVREIFPEAARTQADVRAIAPALRRRLEQQLGRPIDEDSVRALRVFDAQGTLRGWAVVADEMGKYRPITFMVGVAPDFTVRDVAVMVYRETRGDDVKRRRFLTQYRGKRASDPIEVNRDIVGVSGATISVRAVNAGVRRVLAELTALYAAP